MSRKLCMAIGLGFVAGCSWNSEPARSLPQLKVTILELMAATVTPASDTLWGVEDPQTNEEWQVLDAAAEEIIKAFEQAKLGGVGPNDSNWASEPKWQAYADEEIVAGQAARDAIVARDLDALLAAGDLLYPPCEACHIDYNPSLK
jgi:hypothetical protein